MISITLPSIHPDALARTLTNLRDTTRNGYQVVVVSPFEPPNIVSAKGSISWVTETRPLGCNAAHAAGLSKVERPYIMAWVDDHLLSDGWDTEALKDFQEGAKRGRPYLLGLRQIWPEQIGTVFGRFYPYFPIMQTANAKALGWFDGSYRMDFADADLALRFYSAGGMVEWARNTCIIVHRDDERKNGRDFYQPDMQLFLSRWAPTFGKGWKITNLRDFNRDYDLTNPHTLDSWIGIEGRTTYVKGKTDADHCAYYSYK
jgi:hypothetical protein